MATIVHDPFHAQWQPPSAILHGWKPLCIPLWLRSVIVFGMVSFLLEIVLRLMKFNVLSSFSYGTFLTFVISSIYLLPYTSTFLLQRFIRYYLPALRYSFLGWGEIRGIVIEIPEIPSTFLATTTTTDGTYDDHSLFRTVSSLWMNTATSSSKSSRTTTMNNKENIRPSVWLHIDRLAVRCVLRIDSENTRYPRHGTNGNNTTIDTVIYNQDKDTSWWLVLLQYIYRLGIYTLVSLTSSERRTGLSSSPPRSPRLLGEFTVTGTGLQVWYHSLRTPNSHHVRSLPIFGKSVKKLYRSNIMPRNVSLPFLSSSVSSSLYLTPVEKMHDIYGNDNEHYFFTGSVRQLLCTLKWSIHKDEGTIVSSTVASNTSNTSSTSSRRTWIITNLEPTIKIVRLRLHGSSHGRTTGIGTIDSSDNGSGSNAITRSSTTPPSHSHHPRPSRSYHHSRTFSTIQEGTNLSCSINVLSDTVDIYLDNGIPSTNSFDTTSRNIVPSTAQRGIIVASNVNAQIRTAPSTTIVSLPSVRYAGYDFNLFQRLPRYFRIFSYFDGEIRPPSIVPYFYVEGKGKSTAHFHLPNMYSLYQLHDEGGSLDHDFIERKGTVLRYPSDLLFGSSLSVDVPYDGNEDEQEKRNDASKGSAYIYRPVTTACCELCTNNAWSVKGCALEQRTEGRKNMVVTKMDFEMRDIVGSIYSDLETLGDEASVSWKERVSDPHCALPHHTILNIGHSHIVWDRSTVLSGENIYPQPTLTYTIQRPKFIWTNNNRAVLDGLIRAVPYSYQIISFLMEAYRNPTPHTENYPAEATERISRNSILIHQASVFMMDPEGNEGLIIEVPYLVRTNISKMGYLRIVERDLVIDYDVCFKTVPMESTQSVLCDTYLSSEGEHSNAGRLIGFIRSPLRWTTAMESFNQIPYHRSIIRTNHNVTIPHTHFSITSKELSSLRAIVSGLVFVSTSVYLSNHFNKAIVTHFLTSNPSEVTNNSNVLREAHTVVVTDSGLSLDDVKTLLRDRYVRHYQRLETANATTRSQTFECAIESIQLDLLDNNQSRLPVILCYGKSLLLRYIRTKILNSFYGSTSEPTTTDRSSIEINTGAIRIFHNSNPSSIPGSPLSVTSEPIGTVKSASRMETILRSSTSIAKRTLYHAKGLMNIISPTSRSSRRFLSPVDENTSPVTAESDIFSQIAYISRSPVPEGNWKDSKIDPLAIHDPSSSSILLSCGVWYDGNPPPFPSLRFSFHSRPHLWLCQRTDPSSRLRVPIVEDIEITVLPSNDSIVSTVTRSSSIGSTNETVFHPTTLETNSSSVHSHAMQHVSSFASEDRQRVLLYVSKTSIDFLASYFGRSCTANASSRRSLFRKNRNNHKDKPNPTNVSSSEPIAETFETMNSSVPFSAVRTRHRVLKKVVKLKSIANKFVSRLRQKSRDHRDDEEEEGEGTNVRSSVSETVPSPYPVVLEPTLPSVLPSAEGTDGSIRMTTTTTTNYPSGTMEKAVRDDESSTEYSSDDDTDHENTSDSDDSSVDQLSSYSSYTDDDENNTTVLSSVEPSDLSSLVPQTVPVPLWTSTSLPPITLEMVTGTKTATTDTNPSETIVTSTTTTTASTVAPLPLPSSSTKLSLTKSLFSSSTKNLQQRISKNANTIALRVIQNTSDILRRSSASGPSQRSSLEEETDLVRTVSVPSSFPSLPVVPTDTTTVSSLPSSVTDLPLIHPSQSQRSIVSTGSIPTEKPTVSSSPSSSPLLSSVPPSPRVPTISSSSSSSSSLSLSSLPSLILTNRIQVSALPLCLYVSGYGIQLASVHTIVPSFTHGSNYPPNSTFVLPSAPTLDSSSAVTSTPPVPPSLSSSTNIPSSLPLSNIGLVSSSSSSSSSLPVPSIPSFVYVYETNQLKKSFYNYYRKYFLYTVLPRNLPRNLLKTSLRRLFRTTGTKNKRSTVQGLDHPQETEKKKKEEEDTARTEP